MEIESELKQIYEADQSDRVGPNALFSVTANSENLLQLQERDNMRLARVRQLLEKDEIKTAEDYYYAAMIFQHGKTSDDYLLAHILADIAAQMGWEKAKWLCAASLDRYLHSVGQPQIFGSQFNSQDNEWTQEPYNQKLLSDSILQAYNPPSRSETGT